MGPATREWGARLALAAAATIVALLAAELLLRVLPAGINPLAVILGRLTPELRALHEPRPDRGWLYGLRPGADVRSAHYRGVRYQINADGFRDRAYARTKPPGTFRIVVLGDSVIFGFGVQAEESFPKHLEALLAARVAPTAVEVLNLGVNGYNAYNEAMLFADVGVGDQPDLVLVQFCPNDLGNPTLFGVTTQLAVDLPIEAFPDPGRQRRVTLSERVCRRLRTCTLIGHALLGRDPEAPTLDDFRATSMPPVGERELAWLRARYEEFAAVARAHGAAFAVVFVPSPAAVGRRPAPVHQQLVALGREAGWTTVDPLPALQGATMRHRVSLFLPRDPWHLTSLGHRVVAEAIIAELAPRRLLPSEGRPNGGSPGRVGP